MNNPCGNPMILTWDMAADRAYSPSTVGQRPRMKMWLHAPQITALARMKGSLYYGVEVLNNHC